MMRNYVWTFGACDLERKIQLKIKRNIIGSITERNEQLEKIKQNLISQCNEELSKNTLHNMLQTPEEAFE